MAAACSCALPGIVHCAVAVAASHLIRSEEVEDEVGDEEQVHDALNPEPRALGLQVEALHCTPAMWAIVP